MFLRRFEPLKKKVLVVGGGPAGMMAAGTAASGGCEVTLLEKNEKLGKKIYITGKGRCNLTNASEPDVILSNVNTNPKFLYSAVNVFGSDALINFFEKNGLALVTERGRRVFPASGHASDVTKTLESYLRSRSVKIIFNCAAQKLEEKNGKICGVRANGFLYEADSVIIATGGLSYPSTGSSGDGYRFAKKAGHSVAPLFPSLVPLVSNEEWIEPLAGLTLKNVSLKAEILDGKNFSTVYYGRGDMLFTHEGISGPLGLAASVYLSKNIEKQPKITIDLKPALSSEKLDERLQRDLNKNMNKKIVNMLDDLLPKSLSPVVAKLSGIPQEKRACDVTRIERAGLLHTVKNLTVAVSGTAGFDEAVITAGGVCVNEIDPRTMASKIKKGLYFAGEVIDTDAMTGGYNMQIAFSTGYLAGKAQT